MPRCGTAILILAVCAPAAVSSPVALPNGASLREVSFERHVAGLLGRHGCNAGACHGSFQGKGGLRLSLFGYSQAMDYAALTRDALGRRVNVAAPDQSLLLLKPTGQVPHEGGLRFARGSWQYQVIRAWVAQGAKWRPGDGAVKHLEVRPREHRLAGPGQTVALRVVAEFADGSREDVTPFCAFRARDDYVADVAPTGVVHGLRPGDTAVVVSYRGDLATARVLVPAPAASGFIYPNVPEANYIDREVFAKLRNLNVVPSELSGDAEFLRRVSLDAVGTLPTPDEVRAFLADRAPDKRARKVEQLLAHPLHAALWATKLCDVTANNLDVMEGPPELGPKRATMWHDWFRKRLARNVPYDRIVRGVLTATSREGLEVKAWVGREVRLHEQLRRGFRTDYADREGLDLFWRRLANDDFFPLEQMGELTATAFLGVRLECAQCHKHPFDRWTQADYRAWANVFGQTKFGSSPETTAAVANLLEERRKAPPGKAGPPLPRVQEVYVSDHPLRRLPHPETGGPLPAKALGGPEVALAGDARARLCDWLVAPDNPYFARAFVNRVWAHYFGVGLVTPVDGFSAANPPSNERLLDALANDFVRHHFDIRHLERTVLSSRAYQLSSRPNATNAGDRGNFARAYARRLMAEVVADALDAALGVTEDRGPGLPPGCRAVEVAPNRVQNEYLATIFRTFGRPARTTTCDCERSAEPAVPQTLFLMSDPALLKKLAAGQLPKLLAGKKADGEVVEELFLATLSRLPEEREKKAALTHVAGKKDRAKAFADVLWALINTREFILNH
ncbi:MAG TPA: DUF1549 and DUF1553 domain-containing protein [Gemmataceae bacterium]|jgi:hypothetical protein|nr:DUF1549 and DUF1553 domain-containing protein [Gemmataceae bacterium]